MFLRIDTSHEMQIIGKRMQMSLVNNTTGELFRSFMPDRMKIQNRLNTDLLCVQNYPVGFFREFNPTASFEKWAAAEVTSFGYVPDGMHTAIIPAGLYAVFLFRGSNAQANDFFADIYMNWFPTSEFEVDHRPHFDILGSKYKNNDPESEEEIWIPVKLKG